MKKRKQQQNPQQDILSILIILLTDISLVFLTAFAFTLKEFLCFGEHPAALLGAGECSIMKKGKKLSQ